MNSKAKDINKFSLKDIPKHIVNEMREKNPDIEDWQIVDFCNLWIESYNKERQKKLMHPDCLEKIYECPLNWKGFENAIRLYREYHRYHKQFKKEDFSYFCWCLAQSNDFKLAKIGEYTPIEESILVRIDSDRYYELLSKVLDLDAKLYMTIDEKEKEKIRSKIKKIEKTLREIEISDGEYETEIFESPHEIIDSIIKEEEIYDEETDCRYLETTFKTKIVPHTEVKHLEFTHMDFKPFDIPEFQKDFKRYQKIMTKILNENMKDWHCKKIMGFLGQYGEKPICKGCPAGFVEKPSKDPDDKEEKKDKITFNIVADKIQEKYHFVSLKDSDEILYYDKGIYKFNAEALIRNRTQAIMNENGLSEECTKWFCSEVIFHIMATSYIDRNMLDSQPHILNVKNGLLDINTRSIQPHSHKFLSVNQIPVIYDPSITCPTIETFFKQICPDDNDRTVLKEWFGYCLRRDYVIHKAVMLSGDGANGKSTLIELLRLFLGADNTSSVPLHMFDLNRFAVAGLYGKMANVYADLPMTSLENTGMFKMLTGGDMIRAEKKFKSEFYFKNYAKLIFSTNIIPDSKDDTGAFWRRWLLIEFPNEFKGKECNPHILDEITTEQELSGLLNIALDHLDNIIKNKSFSYSKSTEETRTFYIMKSDSIKAFCLAHLLPEHDETILKSDLYLKYAEFCRETGLPTKGTGTLTKYLPKHIATSLVKRGPRGNRHLNWLHIKYRNEDEDEDQDDGIEETKSEDNDNDKEPKQKPINGY